MSFLDSYGEMFENAEFSDMTITNSVSEGINVLEQMNTTIPNASVQEDFNLRSKLYENKELFDDLPQPIEKDNDIEQLETMVTKGQQMLKDKIIEYSKLKGTLEQIQKDKHVFNDQNAIIKRSLMFMGEMNIEDTSIKTDIDNIYNQVDTLNKKINCVYDQKLIDTRVGFDETTNKLLQLRKVYQVLKDSDVSYTCPICLVKQVEMFLVPCGHCFCALCMGKIERQCFMCRKEYIKKSNLYFG